MAGAHPRTPHVQKSATDEYIINFLNEEFGSDIKSLSRIRKVYNKTKESKDSYEKQLSLASTEVPTEIEAAIHDAESCNRKIQQLGDEKDKTCHSILDHTREIQPMVEEMTKVVEQINELEKYSKYLTHVARVEEFSSQIQTALLTESMLMAVEAFGEMTSLYTDLQSSKCKNLLTFTKDTILFWYNILKDKIASEFEDLLKSLRWPLVASSIKAPPPQNAAELRARMELLFRQLLQLHLPDGLNVESHLAASKLTQIPGLKPLILPLQLMIKPLQKRFKFHFYGHKQTNSLDKPEWYFTQVMTWIQDHCGFLDQRIQPLLAEEGKPSLDVKVEFMRGLVALVMEKMAAELKEMMYDEHMFSHLVDEALLFDRELRTGFGYPASLPGSLHVLTEGEAFKKWIHIEKKFAVEKLDSMLSSSSAWQSQYKDIADVDELRVPECGESFMTLMLTITERYKHLPHPSHKLQFLELQLELLEDFRIRCVQVMKDVANTPLSQCFCSILNTAYYVGEVLREWSELVFFLQLQYYRSEFQRQEDLQDLMDNPPDTHISASLSDTSQLVKSLEASQISSVFDESLLPLESTVFEDMINLFDRMKNDMMNNIVNYVFTDVKARSQPYRKDKYKRRI